MNRPQHRIRMVAHVLPLTADRWRARAAATSLGRVVDGLLAPPRKRKPVTIKP